MSSGEGRYSKWEPSQPPPQTLLPECRQQVCMSVTKQLEEPSLTKLSTLRKEPCLLAIGVSKTDYIHVQSAYPEVCQPRALCRHTCIIWELIFKPKQPKTTE